MATKRKRKGGNSGPRKSTTQRLIHTVAAVGAGAVIGAVSGRASLAVGLASIGYGIFKNNQLATVAGAAACVVPGQLSSSEKSTAGGIKGQIADAKSSLKLLAASTLQKTAADKFFPNAFPNLALGDVDYYAGPSLEEVRFQRSLSAISGTDDYESDMGRTADAGYQAMEVSGDISGFADVAEQASAAW